MKIFNEFMLANNETGETACVRSFNTYSFFGGLIISIVASLFIFAFKMILKRNPSVLNVFD